MSVATSTAIAIGAGVSAAAGIGGAAIAAHSQSSATDKAVAAENTSAANTLAFQKEVYGNTLANEQPYMDLGTKASGMLSDGLTSGSLTSAYPGGAFHFDSNDFYKDPAYGTNQAQGEQAIQRTAAAQGGLVSGGALKDAATFTQGLAGNQYQQSYANALAAYNQAYSQFENTQSNTFNRLFSVAGLGQNAVTQTATSGQSAAGTVAGVNENTANTIAGLTSAQGNASGAATLSGVNAVTGGVNQYANYLAQQQMMSGSSYGSTMIPYKPTYAVDPVTGL